MHATFLWNVKQSPSPPTTGSSSFFILLPSPFSSSCLLGRRCANELVRRSKFWSTSDLWLPFVRRNPVVSRLGSESAQHSWCHANSVMCCSVHARPAPSLIFISGYNGHVFRWSISYYSILNSILALEAWMDSSTVDTYLP